MNNYVTQTSDKDKKTALILCACGGFLGIHQFYVGNIGKGILYIFTFGLLSFDFPFKSVKRTLKLHFLPSFVGGNSIIAILSLPFLFFVRVYDIILA